MFPYLAGLFLVACIAWAVYKIKREDQRLESESNEPEDEDEPEDTAQVDSAMNTWWTLADVDTMVMSKADAQRIIRMRRQSLRIAAHFTNKIHAELFPTKDEDEG